MDHVLTLDMYQTAGVGVLALIVGMFLTRKIHFLKHFCIPAPVSGGLLFSLLALALHSLFQVDFSFDGTIKDICMMIFFTSVGFQSNFKVIRQGGRALAVIVLLMVVLIILQNGVAVGIAKAMGQNPLLGMAAGSIPMIGGHGTAGGFSSLLESMGLENSSSVMMAAATFGLVAGSLLGGPLAELLIKRYNLSETSAEDDVMLGMEATDASPEAKQEYSQSGEKTFRDVTKAVYVLLITMALGMGLSKLLRMTGITFPTYFGTLLMGAIIRNCIEMKSEWAKSISIDKVISFGNISLSLFLGMAMITLKLWELAALALPLCAILLAQVILLALFSVFAAFPLLGKNYDSAVLVSGICGFGLGATPNAMANMSAVCFKYRYAVKPFLIVPIVGAMFVDLINTAVISGFLNFI